MNSIKISKHKIFKKTANVLFYDISIEESNASDLVIHESAAISPPDDELGNKQFYIHSHQIDNNRVISGSRTFELINFNFKYSENYIFRDSNFHINKGDIVGIIGESGSGKSTFIDLICGLIPFNSLDLKTDNSQIIHKDKIIYHANDLKVGLFNE